MSVIPVAIVIGIIEDKIANDLSNSDNKVIEHLEDIKNKIKANAHKPVTYKIEVGYKDGRTEVLDIENMAFKNNFVEITVNNRKIYNNSNDIAYIIKLKN